MTLLIEPIVAINEFPTDTEAEVNYIIEGCKALGVEAVPASVWANGGEGAVELAKKVVEVVERGEADFKFLYEMEESIPAKIEKIAKEVYGAEGVDFTSSALKQIAQYEKLGYDKVPICMAKTQYSLSDDPSLLGRPEGFRVTVRDFKVSRGAGFIVALTGDIMTMPGLPKVPAANKIDILEDGEIVGLF